MLCCFNLFSAIKLYKADEQRAAIWPWDEAVT